MAHPKRNTSAETLAKIEGMTINQAAQFMGVSYPTARKVFIDAGMSPRREIGTTAEDWGREYRKVREMWSEGHCVNDIANAICKPYYHVCKILRMKSMPITMTYLKRDIVEKIYASMPSEGMSIDEYLAVLITESFYD